jgi:hypothetical protein
MTHCFKNYNLILTKNLEIDSSFFIIFYFKIFKKFKFNRPIFDEPTKTDRRSPPVLLIFDKISIHEQEYLT